MLELYTNTHITAIKENKRIEFIRLRIYTHNDFKP